MPARLEASQLIDRPVSEVWRFYAEGHVENHTRWDPDIRLEKLTAGPMGVGTRLRRLNTRSGTLVEGTMDIVEFEPNRSLGVLIHDGPVEMQGTGTLEEQAGGGTKLTIAVEIPAMDSSADTSFLNKRLQGSLDKIKQLIEAGKWNVVLPADTRLQ